MRKGTTKLKTSVHGLVLEVKSRGGIAHKDPRSEPSRAPARVVAFRQPGVVS